MDAIESLIETFGRSWKEKSKDASLRALTDVPGYLENLTQTNGSRILQILFHKKKGVLQFIRKVLYEWKKHEIENLKMVLKEAFIILQVLIKSFKSHYIPYVEQTRELCFECIKTTCWYYTRKSAAETMKMLIEYYSHLDLQLDVIVEHFCTSYLVKYNRKEGSVFYIIIGTIASQCPTKSENLHQHINDIYEFLYKDLKYQCSVSKAKQTDEIKIYLDCYIDMLENFKPFDEDYMKKMNYLKKVFSHLSDIIFSQNMALTVKNKTKYLISIHMDEFSDFIFEEYKKWHSSLIISVTEIESYTHIGILRNFYSNMVAYIIKHEDEEAFLYFKTYFMSNLSNKDLSSHQMRLSVYGLGEFSRLYRKYAKEEMHDIFQLITKLASPLYTKEIETVSDYECVAQYLNALAQIIKYMPDVSKYHISIIVELSIFFLKLYAETKMENKLYAMKTLKSAFYHISHLENHFQREYFSTFIRDGILQTCAQTLFIDVEIQKEIENLSEKPITYKNYLPLWHDLFQTNDKEYSRFLVLQILNETVNVLISFINKLNLNVKSRDDDSIFSPSFLLKAENESDFLFFINLIDLYYEIFYEIDSSLLHPYIEKLLDYFIKCSYKHQMISGFYKLIEVIFKKSDVFTDHEAVLSKSTCELINQYLSDTLKLVYDFSGELQLSCIHMIFSTPSFFIKNLINDMIPIFKIAFNIGLTDLSIAYYALYILEHWIKNMDYQCPVNFLKKIIYYLEPYLSSEESLIESFQEIKKQKKYNNYFNKNVKSFSTEESLEEFQKKVLLFFGSLDSDIMLDYIYEKSNEINASWSKRNDLQCELYFPNDHLKIQLDTLLPRIIELTKSGDLKVKISACELLHSVITIILGNKLADKCFNEDLCFITLKLACDTDDVVRSLYHPFVIQLIHYFSSRLMKDSRVPQYFLNSLFNGLTEKFHTSMRDFCGQYLKEFVLWSARQSPENDLTNIRAIVRKITSFALYPSNNIRSSGAIAFNNLYTILRENVHAVNVYWLEFLYAFVKSLEASDDLQTSEALGHVEKVIRLKKNLFIAKSIERRKPPGFTDETLRGTLLWLFHQCGTTSTSCRHQCMEIFEKLLSCLNHSDITELFTVPKIHEIALANLGYESSWSDSDLTPKDAREFLKCLHFYSWIFEKKFLPIEYSEISQSFDDVNGVFFKSIVHFVSILINKSNSLRKSAEGIGIMNEMTLEIINFLMIISNDDVHVEHIPWNENLLLMIILCLIKPLKIEITAKNLRIFEEFHIKLESLLKTIKIRNILSESLFQQFNDIFFKQAETLLIRYDDITKIIDDKEDIDTLKQFVNGLIMLKKCNIFDSLVNQKIDIEYLKNKLNVMFESLNTVLTNCNTCKKLDDHILEYLTKLIKLFLIGKGIEVIELLMQYFMIDTPLIMSNGKKIAHGQYFVETFKESILEFLLKEPVETLKVLDGILKTRRNTVRILCLVDELLLFAQHQRGSEESESLANEVIARFSLFSQYLNDLESREALFVNINKKAVQLKKDPTEALATKIGAKNEFKTWLYSELTRNVNTDLSKKVLVLQNFAVCLVYNDNKDHNEFQYITQFLRDTDSELYSSKLENNELLKFQSVTCFKTLLKILTLTKSVAIYEACIQFSAGIYKFLIKGDITEHLTPYFNSIDNEKALQSLQMAYNIFMKLTKIQSRLDVLKKFLLPSMELCKSSVINEFYENKAQEMLECLRIDMDKLNCESTDRKKLIVTQISCYNMFEVMFAKHEIKLENFVDPLNPTKERKRLNQILMLQIISLRSYEAKSDDEKEITRLLQCAAVNCSVAIASLKEEERFYKYIFFMCKEKNQLLWERIVDCDRQYNFSQSMASSTIRKERKMLVNIRRSLKYQQQENSSTYIRRYDLASLTLIENVHDYDLNDTSVLASATKEQDHRLDLSFENDEINEHECMPMLVGVIMHLYNNEIVSLPESEERELPSFLTYFREGFLTKDNNARLLLMKIVCNTKLVFLRYMKEFFLPICEAAYMYVAKNPLNYIIRDILVMFIESKFVPITENDKIVAHRLLRNLIPRLPNASVSIYRYNLEIFESLCLIYGKLGLSCPVVEFEDFIKKNPDLLIQVIVILSRSSSTWEFELLSKTFVIKLIKESVANYSGNRSILMMCYEAMGRYLNLLQENSPSFVEEERRLTVLFETLNKTQPNLCIRCIYALNQGCNSESKCKNLFKLARLNCLDDEHKALSLELFLQRINKIDFTELPIQLLLETQTILRDRVLGCESVVLKIVAKLINLLPETELRLYLDLVVSGFTEPEKSLLEHRLLAYGLLKEAYAKYPSPSSIGNLCCKALIRALIDPAEEIQNLALDFWSNCARLPDTSCSDRLLAILNLYEPELHDAFPRFLCAILLELINKSRDAKRVMFQPLADCTFRDFEILVPRRRLNLGSMAPLFAPSLASQINQLVMTNTLAPTFAASLQLLATNRDYSFEPTAPQFAIPQTRKLPDPIRNKLSRRVTEEVMPQTRGSIHQLTVQKRNEFHKILKKESEARRNSAKMYRKYRIGDFPDVEITNSTFVETLRQFIMKDWLACKSFAVTLVCNLLDHLKGSEKYTSFINGLTMAFLRVTSQEKETRNNFVPILLEIILYAKDVTIDTKLIGNICKTMNLHTLGVLLLEDDQRLYSEDREVNDEMPPNKRIKLITLNRDNLLQLASLYKSIGMTDVVASIFKQSDLFSKKLQEATLAQLEGNWSTARLAYEAAYKSVESDAEKDHCLEGELESMAHLANWDKINSKIYNILNNDYETIWNDSRKNQLLPWIFEAQLQAALVNFTSDKEPDNENFFEYFINWMSERETKMKRNYGEEIAMFLLCGSASSKDEAKCALECCIDRIRENWIRSSPLSRNSRSKMLLKLRAMFNIDFYVKTLQSLHSTTFEEEIVNLLKYWDQHLPNPTNELLSWNKLVIYRLSFMHLLHEKIQNISEESTILENLTLSGIKQRMHISELAINMKNPSVIKKHLLKIDVALEQLNLIGTELYYKYELNASKYKFINSETTNISKKKFDYYLSSWKVAENLYECTTVGDMVKIDVNYHLFDLVSSLKKEVENDKRLLDLVSNDEFVSATIRKYNYPSILRAMEGYCFEKLKETCLLGSEKLRGDNYAKFGQYCYNRNQNSKTHDPESDKHLVSSIIDGMILGSSEAARYFPCLLKSNLYKNNEEIKKIFSSKIEKVQSWIFLSCKDQVLTYLNDETLKELLIPVIEKIFDDYPNAIICDFNQLIKSIGQNVDSNIFRKVENLYSNKGIKEFLEGLHHVCQPELYLKHQLLNLINEEKFETHKNIDRLLTHLYGNDSNTSAKIKQQGAIYRIVLSSYKEKIEKLKEMDVEKAKNYVQIMCNSLEFEMHNRLKNNASRSQALQMKDYSPYLAYFSGERYDIELPGQYDGSRKPMPQYHVKIAKFDRFVNVIQSKCSPIKITVIGNDAKSYSFLVKCGEDLRQDQRLQQIFKTMNNTLMADVNCRNRYLSVNTYHVLPLSNNLGLIEWVNNTKSLKEFIEFRMKDVTILTNLAREYQSWIQKAGQSNQINKIYRDALMKYSTNEVVTKMTKLISQLDCNLLKKTFTTISPSLESFMSLRHNFITSYATMSIIHWLTGVGDRHLENLLIEVKSGKCYAIDFGLAFGTGMDQSPPELVPFRLTSQILELLKPFDETALFGITMTHVLSALRKEHGPLFACLDMFIREPLDWTQNINKNIEEDIEKQSLDWIPQQKINIVKKKFNGIHPCKIILEELSNVHFKCDEADPFYVKYRTIINGEDYPTSMRLKFCKDILTLEEQVLCLLEQAKDLNLLGRMYYGWIPFA